MTSSCFGSKSLYDYVNNNPFFSFTPMLRASYQADLPNIPRLVSVINVQSVDITGNAVILNPGGYCLPGFEGKLNFSLASSMSRSGKSIVTVRSLNKEGKSNIVVAHKNSEQVRSTLGTTRYVMTEYGIANIAGKSIRERVLALVDIARDRGIKTLFAFRMPQNKGMGKVFESDSIKPEITETEDEVEYIFDLRPAKKTS
ncbi:MAG: acetyl-CoA hydrolase/transferase C-terminal domain-containing protein [Smithella sp.]